METSTLTKETRKKLKLTQEELAKRINKKRSTVANYESGNIVPPGDIVLQLQALLRSSK